MNYYPTNPPATEYLPKDLSPLPAFGKEKSYLSGPNPPGRGAFEIWAKWVNAQLGRCQPADRLPISLDCEGVNLGTVGGSLELIQVGVAAPVIKGGLRNAKKGTNERFPPDIWLIDTDQKGQEGSPPELVDFVLGLLDHPNVAIIGWGLVSDLSAIRSFRQSVQFKAQYLDLQLFSSRPEGGRGYTEYYRVAGLFTYCKNNSIETLKNDEGFKFDVGHEVMLKGDRTPWFPRPLMATGRGDRILISAYYDILYIHQAFHQMAKSPQNWTRFKQTWNQGLQKAEAWSAELALGKENCNPSWAKNKADLHFCSRSGLLSRPIQGFMGEVDRMIKANEKDELTRCWDDIYRASSIIGAYEHSQLPAVAQQWDKADLDTRGKALREAYLKKYC